MLTVLTQKSEAVNCMTAENTVSSVRASAGRQHVPHWSSSGPRKPVRMAVSAERMCRCIAIGSDARR